MTAKIRSALLAGCVLTALSAPAFAGFQWTAPANIAPTAGAVMPMQQRPNEPAPRAAAAPIAPVMSESLPGHVGAISAGQPISTTPDGPAAAAPIYGQNANGGLMTNDPVTWNTGRINPPIQTGQTTLMPTGMMPRGPQNIMPAEAVSLNTPTPAAPYAAQMPAAVAPVYAAPSYPASSYDVAQGFGRDLPLVMAIRQIVPPQYGFVFGDDIDVSSKVSWQGGQPWDIVLQNTLAPLGMNAQIGGNTISISRANTGMNQMIAAGNAPAMGGPQVTSNMMSASNDMTMTATPVITQQTTTATAPAGPNDNFANDMGMNGDMGSAGLFQQASYSGSTPADLMATTTWTAPRNSTLRGILEGWSEKVGVELYWASEYDYPIQSAVSLQGTFEEAVQTLLKGLTDSKPRPMARLHPNLPNGPAVLVIETRQNAM